MGIIKCAKNFMLLTSPPHGLQKTALLPLINKRTADQILPTLGALATHYNLKPRDCTVIAIGSAEK